MKSLPVEPIIKIRPNKNSYGFKHIWEFRELIFFLIWRDLKVRYKQTFLGIVWVILHPFLMTLVFTIFLGRLINVPSDGIPYPLFVYSGLLIWTFFSNTVSASSYSLISNNFMITKVYFPHIIIPLATLGVRIADFSIAALMIIIFVIFYGIVPSLNFIFLPVSIFQVIIVTFSFSVLFSVLTAKFRDIGTILPVFLQVWMFSSPVVYSKSLIPKDWQFIYSFNPFVGIIDGFRASLFNVQFDWLSISISLTFTILIFLFSLFLFQEMDSNLADTL